MKQMFDMSEKLMIGVKTINWEDSSWKYLSLVGDEDVISLLHKGCTYFRFFVMPWKDEREPTIKLCMGRQIGVVQKFTGIQKLGQN